MTTPNITLTNLIIPEVFNQYTAEESVKLDRLIQSGIVAPEAALGSFIARGGEKHHVPFWKQWNDADNIGTSDSTAITPVIRSAKEQIVIIQRRNLAYGNYDLAKWVAGSDPLGDAVTQAAKNVAENRQSMVMAMLQGQMTNGTTAGSSSAAFVGGDYLVDIRSAATTGVIATPTATTPGTGNLSATTIITAKGKMGDAGTKLSAIVMHSHVYYNLERQDLISFLVASRDVGFGSFQGLTVIVDDLATAFHTGTDAATAYVRFDQYTTFICGAGLVKTANSGIQSVVDRNERLGTGSGEESLIVRRQEIYATEGFSYKNASVAPANSIFSTKATWEAVYERKNIPFVAIVSNG